VKELKTEYQTKFILDIVTKWREKKLYMLIDNNECLNSIDFDVEVFLNKREVEELIIILQELHNKF
jgi:hypothetical protein